MKVSNICQAKYDSSRIKGKKTIFEIQFVQQIVPRHENEFCMILINTIYYFSALYIIWPHLYVKHSILYKSNLTFPLKIVI